MLDKYHLSCSEKLLRYDDRSEGILYTTAGVAYYVGGSKRYTECSGGIDASVHARYCRIKSVYDDRDRWFVPTDSVSLARWKC